MTERDYNKYMKYKRKYMKLRRGGGGGGGGGDERGLTDDEKKYNIESCKQDILDLNSIIISSEKFRNSEPDKKDISIINNINSNLSSMSGEVFRKKLLEGIGLWKEAKERKQLGKILDIYLGIIDNVAPKNEDDTRTAKQCLENDINNTTTNERILEQLLNKYSSLLKTDKGRQGGGSIDEIVNILTLLIVIFILFASCFGPSGSTDGRRTYTSRRGPRLVHDANGEFCLTYDY